MSIHIFGIRHHGAGSARSLVQALTELQPDALLIEGAPEMDAIIPWAAHEHMQPPVAALVYSAEDNHRAVYYPFAEFSPEWQALQYALAQKIFVQFMDLPMSLQFAQEAKKEEEAAALDESPADVEETELPAVNMDEADFDDIRRDPLKLLAQAAGFEDSERWWSHLVEERRDSSEIFTAIAEAMTALRAEVDKESPENLREQQREAQMRTLIRAAEKQGFQKIAVVCGAWHVPALQKAVPAKHDKELLKGLPKTKTLATWIPWTYDRLSRASGYGAGIDAPNWYHVLWQQPNHLVTHWLTLVAQLFREHGIDISSAHVIEAVRLAEALAAMRGRPLPSLDELNDAVQTVMLFADPLPLKLLRQKLIIGERLGHVPDDAPMTPLQSDLLQQQKRLRLTPTSGASELVLDLRKDNDLQRSYLLRQLRLLGIAWGETGYARGKGTFKEAWRLQWMPEYMIQLIEAGQWGNTVSEAASNFTIQTAQKSTNLEELSKLAHDALFANLENAVAVLIDCLQNQAAIATDILHLMQVLPSLAQLLRYGDVRKTSLEQVAIVVDGLITRICIGLPAACSSLNEEAAEQMFKLIQSVQEAVSLLANEDFNRAWYGALQTLSTQNGLHGLLSGHCCRLLLQAEQMDTETVAQRFSVALSVGNDPAQSAAWADGFLRGSGQLLIYDEPLWNIIDNWVSQLTSEAFQACVPMLRRTFSTFDAPIRRQLGERVQQKQAILPKTTTVTDYNADAAKAVLPLLAQILGLKV